MIRVAGKLSLPYGHLWSGQVGQTHWAQELLTCQGKISDDQSQVQGLQAVLQDFHQLVTGYLCYNTTFSLCDAPPLSYAPSPMIFLCQKFFQVTRELSISAWGLSEAT
jgi:hypothetical protein